MVASEPIRLAYVASVVHPPSGAIRAFGARLIAREVELGGSGQLHDRVDTAPDEPRLDDPACPEGKRAFAAWVNKKGYPFLHAYVKRCGLPEGIMAMKDGAYAIQATTNGRHSGYLYVCMYEMEEGVDPPVTETPIPPPHPSTLTHEYVESTERWYAHYKRKPCQVCGGTKSDRRHPKAKGAR